MNIGDTPVWDHYCPAFKERRSTWLPQCNHCGSTPPVAAQNRPLDVTNGVTIPETIRDAVPPPAPTCANCKHWRRYPLPSNNSMAAQFPDWTKRGECLGGLADFIDCGSPGFSFDPPEDFSCVKWEPKP